VFACANNVLFNLWVPAEKAEARGNTGTYVRMLLMLHRQASSSRPSSGRCLGIQGTRRWPCKVALWLQKLCVQHWVPAAGRTHCPRPIMPGWQQHCKAKSCLGTCSQPPDATDAASCSTCAIFITSHELHTRISQPKRACCNSLSSPRPPGGRGRQELTTRGPLWCTLYTMTTMTLSTTATH
jgi:hypothetical protein